MEIPAPERVEPRKTGNQVVDLVLSICALLISALSIFLAWYTGDSMDQLVQANSWPALQLASGNSQDDGTPAIVFTVTNAGSGPAQIHRVDFLVDGVDVSARGGYLLQNLTEACCGDVFQKVRAGQASVKVLGTERTRRVSRSFLSPGRETVALLWARTDTNTEIWRAFDEARKQGRITLRACYCSVFNECWVAETDAFPPRKVDDCSPENINTIRGR